MRKTFAIFLVLLFAITFLRPQEVRAEMPAKAKAMVTIIGYGTAGGAILGAASMAFGTSSRAIAQGASLGLYAGILFGGYVLLAHHQKKMGSYDDDSSPYKESSDIYGDEYQDDQGGSSEGEPSNSNGFFDRHQIIQNKFNHLNAKGSQLPPLYINLVNYHF